MSAGFAVYSLGLLSWFTNSVVLNYRSSIRGKNLNNISNHNHLNDGRRKSCRGQTELINILEEEEEEETSSGL